VLPLRRLLAVAALAVTVVACSGGGEPDIEVVGDVQAAEPVAGSSQVAMTLANRGDGDDELVAASTPAALAVELHLTERDDERTSMGVAEAIPLPAGEEIAFRPGRTHLMLVVPDETVRTGGTLELVLEFERSEPLTLDVPVVDLLDLAEDAFDADAADAEPAGWRRPSPGTDA
jgi:periplasmic copper chaperone A